jgi:hypothetical protein
MTTLNFDVGVLHSAGTSFDQVADGLGSLQAGAPLGDAAAAVSSLRTAAACRTVQSDVVAATAEAADGARAFSENVQAAARWYEMRDQTAAEAITKIDIPK